MSAWDEGFCDDLQRIARTLTSNRHVQEDLVQIGRIRVWEMELKNPRHTRSWYSQRCKRCMQDYLKQGRSVDSYKRRQLHVPLDGEDEERGDWVPQELIAPECVFGDVSSADEMRYLASRFQPMQWWILAAFQQGYTAIEIARKLGVTHQAIAKHRKQIAERLAVRAGADKPRNKQNTRKTRFCERARDLRGNE
jgi:DNA-directed RNA polymerase specialized sigma24 family protein